jgi:hypothetical protein
VFLWLKQIDLGQNQTFSKGLKNLSSLNFFIPIAHFAKSKNFFDAKVSVLIIGGLMLIPTTVFVSNYTIIWIQFKFKQAEQSTKS